MSASAEGSPTRKKSTQKKTSVSPLFVSVSETSLFEVRDL